MATELETELGLRTAAIKTPDDESSVAAWVKSALNLGLDERRGAAVTVVCNASGDSKAYRAAVSLLSPTYGDVRARCG